MDYFSLRMGLPVLLSGCYLIPAVLAFAESRVEIPLPPRVCEQEISVKPTSGLGKRTELLLGETVIGERQYYDGGVLFEEKLYKNSRRIREL